MKSKSYLHIENITVFENVCSALNKHSPFYHIYFIKSYFLKIQSNISNVGIIEYTIEILKNHNFKKKASM